MIALRWLLAVAAAVTVGALIVTPVGAVSVVLAGFFAGFFLGLCAALGAFDRSVWVQDIPETHPDALGSLDRMARR